MQLTTTYSSSCGLSLGKPELYDLFYPVAHSKFITIDTEGAEALQYPHWQDVIDFVRPFLVKKNIDIYQLGRPDDRSLSGVHRTNGNLIPNQFSFIIKHSLVHITTNNFSAFLASHIGNKTIVLSGSPLNPKELFSKSNKNIKTVHPSKSITGKPISIQSIAPETIANLLLDFLGIEHHIPYETVFVGHKYCDGVEFVECIPNQALALQSMGIPSIIYRMDLDYNVQNLFNQLQQGKCVVVTNKPIDIELLRNFKQNIKEFVYVIEEKHDPQFCKEVQHLGVPITLISYLDEDKINKCKLDYMDTSNIHQQTLHTFKDVPDFENLNIDELYFKSHKYTFSHQKLFLSQASERHGVAAVDKSEIQKVIDSADFWKNLEIYAIFKKIS